MRRAAAAAPAACIRMRACASVAAGCCDAGGALAPGSAVLMRLQAGAMSSSSCMKEAVQRALPGCHLSAMTSIGNQL